MCSSIFGETEKVLTERSFRPPKVNEYKHLSKFILWVYGGEGPVPHFHITTSDPDDLLCCVCLHVPAYFDHGVEFKSLNSKLRIELNEFLVSPDKKYKDGRTIWQSMCNDWINNNGNFNFPTFQPNYINLDENNTTKTINIHQHIIKDQATHSNIIVYSMDAK